jgi:hypothetical protein
MRFKYGTLPSYQIHAEKERLQGAIYKLLPYKEDNYELLDKYFVSLLQRVSGLNRLFMEQPQIITLMSLNSPVTNNIPVTINTFGTHAALFKGSCRCKHS